MIQFQADDSELNHISPAVQHTRRQRLLNLLFHFKSDTSEESLGNCLFHYVVSLNNVKVDVSLSQSLSFFQLKRETAEEAPGSLRTGLEEASVAAYKIPPSPLCNHSVTGMCMIFNFSVSDPP